MQEHLSHEEQEELNELLQQYENLRNGKSHSFIEEDAFERIIDYFDDKDDLTKALNASETALEYFPFSSQLLIKKADLLLHREGIKMRLTYSNMPHFLTVMISISTFLKQKHTSLLMSKPKLFQF